MYNQKLIDLIRIYLLQIRHANSRKVPVITIEVVNIVNYAVKKRR